MKQSSSNLEKMRKCRNAGGSESQVKGFTSLLGTQKKILLYELSSKLNEFLHPDTYACATVKNMCDVFDSLYNKMSDLYLTVAAANNVFDEGKAWIDLFCSLRGERPGYSRPRITPYMHTIACHLYFFVQKHGCLKTFTVEGAERNIFFPRRNSFQK